ncbi:MAG: transposase [Calditrichaeota bacterium]|nr:MAG: transposase [Calditrichota bacterium]
MSRTRYKIFSDMHPYFLTATIVNWLPVFAKPLFAQVAFDSLNFLMKENRIKIFAYILMENHMHLIAYSPKLSEEIRSFKSFTARQIIDHLKEAKNNFLLDQLAWHKLRHKQNQDYQLWQEGSHPQEIQTPAMMRQKIEYIHLNPVKRGYVEHPEHWLYSSARNYAGLEAKVGICEW